MLPSSTPCLFPASPSYDRAVWWLAAPDVPFLRFDPHPIVVVSQVTPCLNIMVSLDDVWETIRRAKKHSVDHQTDSTACIASLKGKEGLVEGMRNWICGIEKLNCMSEGVFCEECNASFNCLYDGTEMIYHFGQFSLICKYVFNVLCIWNLTINNTIQYNR